MIITADFVLPISGEPIKNGAIVIEADRIQAVGPKQTMVAAYPDKRVLDSGRAIVMPGLANLHTHLEYTDLGPLSEPQTFLPWIQRLVASSHSLNRDDWLRSARHGAQMLLSGGVTCIGDITTFGPGLEAALAVGLRGICYIEAVGLRGDDHREQMAAVEQKLIWAEALAKGSRLKIGLSPHTVYTISSNALVELGRLAEDRQLAVAIHLAETEAECRLVESGRGELAESLMRIGGHDLIASGGRGISPVELAWRSGLLKQNTLAIHCVHLSEADLKSIVRTEAAVALCPWSNSLLQVGTAPVLSLISNGIRMGVGTDSLASNYSLDLFAEMRLLRTICHQQTIPIAEPGPVPSARDLLYLATLKGAKALGLEDEIGSIEPGKYADLAVIKVSGPPVNDPYEYLVRYAKSDHIVCTFISGQMVYRNPHLSVSR